MGSFFARSRRGLPRLDQAGIGWLIFVIAGAAALLALIRPGLDAFSRVRRFPQIVTGLAEADRDLKVAQAALAEVEGTAAEQYATGVAEGRAEVVGALLAGTLADTPEMVAIGISEDRLVITGRYSSGEVPQGARFQVEVEATGESKGVVEVALVDVEARLVHMECVRRDVAQFWEALERRAIEDPSPSRGVRLAPLSIDLPPVLRSPEREEIEPTTQETAGRVP